MVLEHTRISQASHAPDTRGLSEAAVHGEQGLHLRAPIVAGASDCQDTRFTENFLHRLLSAHGPMGRAKGRAPRPALPDALRAGAEKWVGAGRYFPCRS